MTVADTIKQALSNALNKAGIEDAEVHLEHPAELSHGDYASGIALAKAKATGMNPRALAEKLVGDLGNIEGVAKTDIAGPGFINFTLAPEVFAAAIEEARSADMWGSGETDSGKQYIFEYTDPNPFKAFHIGHLMSNAIGESLARLSEFAGAKVIRANYQGDVGVHVACAIWGIRKLSIHPESADEFGRAYATGATAYKEDETAKAEIDEINKKLYDRTDPELNALYDTGRKESLAAFEKLYAILGTKFDRYFFESEVGPIGKEIVLANPQVFPESDGARVFKGEEYGLHTRVFLSGKGLPTYEAKELGLEKTKEEEFPDTDTFFIITASEVTEYFRVVKKAMEQIFPDIAKKLVHIPHGLMKLPEGKMSSRTGSVITGESLLNDLIDAANVHAAESRADDKTRLAQDVAVGAIKYQVLKQTSSKDIVFDRERALSLEGDSGPYLQYAHARTNAILDKAVASDVAGSVDAVAVPNEVARLVYRFPEIVSSAGALRESHVLTTYLTELAAAFNRWYAQEQILDGTPAAAHKVALVAAVGRTLKNGLWLLGIPSPEKM